MDDAEHDANEILDAVTKVVGNDIVSLRHLSGGLSSGWRGIVEFADRSRAFA